MNCVEQAIVTNRAFPVHYYFLRYIDPRLISSYHRIGCTDKDEVPEYLSPNKVICHKNDGYVPTEFRTLSTDIKYLYNEHKVEAIITIAVFVVVSIILNREANFNVHNFLNAWVMDLFFHKPLQQLASDDQSTSGGADSHHDYSSASDDPSGGAGSHHDSSASDVQSTSGVFVEDHNHEPIQFSGVQSDAQ